MEVGEYIIPIAGQVVLVLFYKTPMKSRFKKRNTLLPRCMNQPRLGHYSTSKSTKDAELKTQVYAAVDLVFHSSVIEDASPPTCHIPWNGTYLVPSPKNMDMSLLPGCFTGDSREGYHMTYYWFYILDWTFG
ncbi:hypothetical protein KUTeg_018253 [Tegillarca granosa]|uniref:Uncharacterized protein n=1 Tax=Tegillarca granosa TaxID=220873 RepID=A0ABQ9EHI5_TEGGR|nr:hypothetical protein KUTeg_018253 [Tegillarca granosa]